MRAGLRLTSCAASDHPNPAVAVGEVVGHLQNSLDGSPQFTLVLVDERIGSTLSTVAGAVHRLLGPDLLLAAVGPHVAGADHLTVSRGSVVAWALCGVEVAAIDRDSDAGPIGSARSGVLTMVEHHDGAVTVVLRGGPDIPDAVFISGEGRLWRPAEARILFPPGSATVVRGRGQRDVGPSMVVTEARGRTLLRLDHVTVRAVLVDQLETTDAFVDGPSIEFPPLRIVVDPPAGDVGGHRIVDVVTVDPEEGSAELSAPVQVGDRIQLIADDPDSAIRVVGENILNTRPRHDRAVLVDRDPSALGDDLVEPIATAAVHVGPTGGVAASAGPRPWVDVTALVVDIIDED